MEFYDDWMLGIDWFEYERMYPDERRSPYISRFMEINMLQIVLGEGIKKWNHLVLMTFGKQQSNRKRGIEDGKHSETSMYHVFSSNP
ncbi:hypothetical protein CRE_11469 [Caenorhabditis remanei]|uniref:Uncharacterized protein n=1 Tax=Caenorhabditis remanei TaxID=31234 RepID=E3NBH5_CAERE|nr:hypothetical protein CRE_11469 [Caenorhabditis remanei]